MEYHWSFVGNVFVVCCILSQAIDLKSVVNREHLEDDDGDSQVDAFWETDDRIGRNLLSKPFCTVKVVERSLCQTRCRHGRRCKTGSICCKTRDGRKCCVDSQAAANLTIENN